MAYDEVDLHAALAWTLLLSMAAACVALLSGVVAPYGRYAEVRAFGMSWGVPLHPKVAWVVQELPSLLLPVVLFATNPTSAASQSPVNRALLGLFCAHYVNRAIVYPLRLRGGKPTPFGVFLLSFFFCLANGYLQGRFLTEFHVYPASHLWTPSFACGVSIMIAGWCAARHGSQAASSGGACARAQGETNSRALILVLRACVPGRSTTTATTCCERSESRVRRGTRFPSAACSTL